MSTAIVIRKTILLWQQDETTGNAAAGRVYAAGVKKFTPA